MGSLLAFGFLLGMRHALDADHIAAVAALATRSASMRETVKVATVWGAGHALTLMLVVSGMIVLDTTLPPSLDLFFELGVGVLSIALGIDVLRRARRRGVHLHVHDHDGARHFHVHAHEPGRAHNADSHRHRHVRGLLPRALLVGGLHGMAGSAVLFLVWLQTIPAGIGLLGYVAVFAIGTVLGMIAFSVVIAVPLRRAAQMPLWFARGVDVAVGVAALAVGVQIVASIVS